MKSFIFATAFTALGCFMGFSQETVTEEKKEKQSYFKVTADVNFAYRLAKIDNSFNVNDEQYLKNLKSGVSYDISAYYMYSEYTGIGLKYNVYKSSASAHDAYITAPNGDTGFGFASDDITMSYIGVSMIENLIKRETKHKLYLEASIGYQHYKDEVEALGSYTVSRGCLASNLGFSYQYEAFENFSIGPKISLTGGTIGKVKIEGPDGFNETVKFDDDKKELLIRFDAGVTASYRF
jgi:hypothetical protein